MPSMEELQKVLAKNKVTLQTEEDCLEVIDVIIACPQATRAVVLTDYQTLEWTVKTQLHIMNDICRRVVTFQIVTKLETFHTKQSVLTPK